MTTTLLLGAGDLGTQIGLTLREAGSDVVAVRRRAQLVPAALHGISCDLTQGADAIRVALEQVTPREGWPGGPELLVVCLTADGRDEAAYRATYVDAVADALTAVTELGWAPKRAVFVSSTAVCASEGVVDETTPADPSTPTAHVLLEAEQRFTALLPASTRGIVVRPSGIYGPGREWFLGRVRDGDIGDPSRMTHRVHRDDLARAVAHLLTMRREPAETYIVTDDSPAPAGEVASWLAARLGCAVDPSWAAVQPQDRRLCNDRLHAAGFSFGYPSYREGYTAVLGAGEARHP